MSDAVLTGNSAELGINAEAYAGLQRDLAVLGVDLKITDDQLERRGHAPQVDPLVLRLLTEVAIESLKQVGAAVRDALRRRKVHRLASTVAIVGPNGRDVLLVVRVTDDD